MLMLTDTRIATAAVLMLAYLLCMAGLAWYLYKPAVKGKCRYCPYDNDAHPDLGNMCAECLADSQI